MCHEDYWDLLVRIPFSAMVNPLQKECDSMRTGAEEITRMLPGKENDGYERLEVIVFFTTKEYMFWQV